MRVCVRVSVRMRFILCVRVRMRVCLTLCLTVGITMSVTMRVRVRLSVCVCTTEILTVTHQERQHSLSSLSHPTQSLSQRERLQKVIRRSLPRSLHALQQETRFFRLGRDRSEEGRIAFLFGLERVVAQNRVFDLGAEVVAIEEFLKLDLHLGARWEVLCVSGLRGRECVRVRACVCVIVSVSVRVTVRVSVGVAVGVTALVSITVSFTVCLTVGLTMSLAV